MTYKDAKDDVIMTALRRIVLDVGPRHLYDHVPTSRLASKTDAYTTTDNVALDARR